ncbi:MAG: pantetheine-phosphate adenylyltransferase [Planctomycetales bacterium]|nr:pantetheine-phosphate adenylyltransferase [Planctomycetales bacterium]
MSKQDYRIGVYTGSFDPVTLGHLNVIERASLLFDELIIGVGVNTEKRPMFDPAERVQLLRMVLVAFTNVRVTTFEGLAVNFVRACGSRIMVRGVRPLTDIAGEFTMLMANRQLDATIETVFLMADEKYSHVSSSLIKQIVPLSNDEMLSRFVPREIIPKLRAKMALEQ